MTKVPAPRVLVPAAELKSGFNPVRAILGLARGWPFTLRNSFSPTFDVNERHDVYVVRGDLPGVKVQDLEVLLSQKRVKISGKREEENPAGGAPELRYRSERPYGKFSRTLKLPPEVDVTQCQADLRDGVLTLELPKTHQAVLRKIAVKADRART